MLKWLFTCVIIVLLHCLFYICILFCMFYLVKVIEWCKGYMSAYVYISRAQICFFCSTLGSTVMASSTVLLAFGYLFSGIKFKKMNYLQLHGWITGSFLSAMITMTSLVLSLVERIRLSSTKIIKYVPGISNLCNCMYSFPHF